jgi:hypothetical protein
LKRSAEEKEHRFSYLMDQLLHDEEGAPTVTFNEEEQELFKDVDLSEVLFI